VQRVFGSGCSRAGCVEFAVEAGSMPKLNPFTKTNIECGFSSDGASFIDRLGGTLAVSCGGWLDPDKSVSIPHKLDMPQVPDYFVARARYERDAIKGDGKEGTAFIKIK
jgi:hypothetical protein